MSASSSPCVLVVADPGRVAELAEALSEPLPIGAIDLVVSAGGDDTIELFAALEPRVVVLTASLEIGDAKSLIEVLREMVPRDELVIVLVGDDDTGPVRTALDAIDLKADHFVPRPVSVKALRFAVGGGLERVARALGELAPADPSESSGSSRVLAEPADANQAASATNGAADAANGAPAQDDAAQPVSGRTSTPLRGSGASGSGAHAAVGASAEGDASAPGDGRPLVGHITESPFVRSNTAPRFSALVEAGDVPPMMARVATRLAASPNGEGEAPAVTRAPTDRGTGVPPLADADGGDADPSAPAADASSTGSASNAASATNAPGASDGPSATNGPSLPRAPTDRGTGISMVTPALVDPGTPPDPSATRAALRARWEALADSIGGVDLDDDGDFEPDTQDVAIQPIEIQPPSATPSGSGFHAVPPAAAWRPEPTLGGRDDADPPVPVREPTLILHDDVLVRAAPVPEAAPPSPAGAVTEQRGAEHTAPERWSHPVLLAELIDRTRDSSRELLANVGRGDEFDEIDDLDEDDDIIVGHPEHTPPPHVLRGGGLDALERPADRRDPPPEPSEPPPRPSEDRIGGRDFARQLRAKMSMMAQRLFQSDSPAAQPSVDVGPRHDHHTEIDLAALSEEPALGGGVTEIGTVVPLDPVQLTTSPGTWDTQVRERGLPDAGEIVRGVSDAAMIIARMFAMSFTGRVGFRRDDVEKVVYFDGGRPVFASSNEPGDRMGELLVREGKITAAQYERCQVVVAQSGRRMGEILVDLGYLKRRELLPAVRRHVEDILYSLFGWDRGHYHVTPEPNASAERIRLSRHPASLVLEGIRRKLDRTTLEKVLGPPSTVIDVPDRERLGGILGTGDLAAEERAALAAFDGQADLAQVAQASGVDLADVLPLAWGLCVLGLATARRAEIEHDESTALVGETDLAIDRERVRARWQLVTEADYFALLGVRRDATGFEIRRAYQAARRDFAPEGFPPDLRRELARELEEIGSVLDEAFRVLRDDRLRQTYLANLIE